MLQQIERHEDELRLKPCSSDLIDDILQSVVTYHSTGWFVLEGYLDLNDTGELRNEALSE